MGSEVID